MNIVIKGIEKKDYTSAIQFAIKGMHFDWYFNDGLLRNMYGKYFWYSELNKATQILAAYVDNKLVGVLLANMKDESKLHSNVFEKTYVRFIDFLQNTFFKDSGGLYESTTFNQLQHFLKNHDPDGEIVFLAADKELNIKGIGTTLLNAFEKIEKGKLVYLYTDDACNYNFYERKGFVRNEEDQIILDTPKGDVTLNCYLYSKRIEI